MIAASNYAIYHRSVLISWSFNLNSDYINIQKLEQDHPCVIKLIRLMYLDPPSAREVPYNLTPTADTSGEYEAVGDAFYILKEKV